MANHTGHRSRVKEEFLTRGLDGWPDHRALELLLFFAIPQGDVNGLAHNLVEHFGSLAGVLDASVDELLKVPGVGTHTATLIHLISPLCGRYCQEREDMGELVQTSEEAAAHLRTRFFGARQEKVCILCLDGKNKLLGIRQVAEGSIHATDINIRRIAEEALGLRAAGIYLAHNHVSNLAFPSAADWESTDTIRSHLEPIGIRVIDHIIFVDGDAVSMNQSERQGKRPIYQLF